MSHSAGLGVEPSFALPSVQGEADAIGLGSICISILKADIQKVYLSYNLYNSIDLWHDNKICDMMIQLQTNFLL